MRVRVIAAAAISIISCSFLTVLTAPAAQASDSDVQLETNRAICANEELAKAYTLAQKKLRYYTQLKEPEADLAGWWFQIREKMENESAAADAKGRQADAATLAAMRTIKLHELCTANRVRQEANPTTPAVNDKKAKTIGAAPTSAEKPDARLVPRPAHPAMMQ
ncbi:MAG TPA: hypothetical protein VJB59_09045 [Bdellovibrionota bacterium]|nr:hypothetical protein [Bdellovibrionota bacterium]